MRGLGNAAERRKGEVGGGRTRGEVEGGTVERGGGDREMRFAAWGARFATGEIRVATGEIRVATAEAHVATAEGRFLPAARRFLPAARRFLPAGRVRNGGSRSGPEALSGVLAIGVPTGSRRSS